MARARFANLDKGKAKTTEASTKAVDQSWRKHQSAVTSLAVISPTGEPAFPMVTSTAQDGRLVMWDLTKSPVPASIIGL